MKLTFPMLLFLVFLVLKLTDVIDWSWWWVSAPMWIPLAIAAVCYGIAGLIYLFETPEQRKARKLQESVDALSRALRKQRY